jgi:hypothetical protein
LLRPPEVLAEPSLPRSLRRRMLLPPSTSTAQTLLRAR